VEESVLKGSQKAVKDLIQFYGVSVEDVSSNKLRDIQKCAALYRLKSSSLGHDGSGVPHMGLVHHGESRCSTGPKKVCIDYLSILTSIYKQFKVVHTSIEVVEYAQGYFKAWCIITPPGSTLGFDCIIGDLCRDQLLAKQNVARRVIAYLTPIYNFEVIDANYDRYEILHQTFLCNLEREGCQALRERSLKVMELAARSAEEAKDQTPTNSEAHIPSRNSPPLPPKKRPYRSEPSSSAIVPLAASDPPVFFQPPDEFEQAFKRTMRRT
jgi:hypothetical protein